MRFMHSHIFALEVGSNIMKTCHSNNGAWVKQVKWENGLTTAIYCELINSVFVVSQRLSLIFTSVAGISTNKMRKLN